MSIQRLSSEQLLSGLNPEQRQAVEQIYGPVMVVAGPGTGKTQILASRILNIVLQGHAGPAEILCLTYTEAGAIAMRKRLLQFMGADAYLVNIRTFHAFCNQVIQENKDLFGVSTLESVSELEQMELMQDLIRGLDISNPLKPGTGELFREASNLLYFFSLMKKENWSPGYIAGRIGEHLENLRTDESMFYKRSGRDYKAGDFKQRDYEKIITRFERTLAAAEAFQTYQDLMQQKGRYDYDDMIQWVIREFEQNPDLLRDYQERYQFLLVDEFQDTSGSQNRVLELLCSDHPDGSPNVFVVGDDDQSIYSFQGAQVENILQFRDRYAGQVATIALKDNYRSTQHILDAAGALISRNKIRLTGFLEGLEKNIRAANPKVADLPLMPEIRVYPNLAQETVAIAQEILKLHEQGVPYHEIAVIYRNHSQAEEIARFLEVNKVPLNIRKRVNILEEPLIERLLNILRYVQSELRNPNSGEGLLFEIMHYDFWDINPTDIARFSLNISKQRMNRRDVTWREELRKTQVQTDIFSQSGSLPAIKTLSNDIEFWIKQAVNLPVGRLLEKIIVGAGVLSRFMNDSEKAWNMQVLNTFFDFIKEEGTRRKGLSLNQLLDTVDIMNKQGITLSLNKITQHTEGVNLVTAHSSKGLEYEYVFLLGCTKKQWDDPRGRSAFSLPPNLTGNNAKGQEEEQGMEESRRLFYVAITRARKHLVMSYGARDYKDKELEKSQFLAELEEHTRLSEQPHQVDEAALSGFYEKVMEQAPQPDLELIDREYLLQLLEDYELSVTHLNNYLSCPISFYFQNLIRVPAAKNPAATFGSAVHDALEKHFTRMLKSPDKAFGPAEWVVRDFETELYRHRDSFTDDEYQQKLDFGRQILPKYLSHYQPTWNRNVQVETHHKAVVNGVPVKGIFDKVEFLPDNKIKIIDYKTGSFERARQKAQILPPQEPSSLKETDSAYQQKRDGGDYWRQAVFYKLIVESERKQPYEVTATVFDFVQPDTKTEAFHIHEIEVGDSDKEWVSAQIGGTYARIQNLEFTKGCGKEDCTWCNFVKYHYRGEKFRTLRELSPEDPEL